MKATKPLFKVLVIFLVLLFVISSCTTSKKTALSCPRFPGYRYDRSLAESKSHRNKPMIKSYKARTRKQPASGHMADFIKKNQGNDPDYSLRGNIKTNDSRNTNNLNKIEYSKSLLASADNSIIPLKRKYAVLPMTNSEISY
ncbi:MAG: hypothetical protein ABSA74_04375, partial [Candidatus Staskawiczbacteria bacterium]